MGCQFQLYGAAPRGVLYALLGPEPPLAFDCASTCDETL